METAKAPPRAWRWDVWHEADRSWHAVLTERNARLLPLPLLLLQKAVPGAADNEGAVSIPRIIHQIWLGPRAIPAACHEWMQTWKVLHPSWGYKAFDAAGNYGEKSDILRYEILAQHGGVYADVDVACLRSFDSLLERPFAFVAGMANTGNVEISNSVMLSVPQHPILQRLIDTIHYKFQQTRLDVSAMALVAQMSGDATLLAALSTAPASAQRAAMDTIARTGPGLLTKTFMAAVGWTDGASRMEGFLAPGSERDGAIALPVDFFSPLPNNTQLHRSRHADVVAFPAVSMAVHYWAKTWL